MLWRIFCVALLTLTIGGTSEYTRRSRIPSYRQSDMTRLERPSYRNSLTEIAYDLPSSSKLWSDQSRQFTDVEEDLTENKCNSFPNQTLFSPHFFSCDSIEEPPIFVVHDVALSNKTGDYVYPLDFSQTLRLFLDLTSYSNRRYDNMRAEVELYRRTTGWLGCGWLKIPCFGLLDNFDVCAENNLSCPIYPGRQVFELKLHPSFLFSGFLQMIHSDKVPYQLIVRLTSNRSTNDRLLCIALQSRIQF